MLLVHAAGSDRQRDFVDTGWVRDLVRAGRRVMSVDCRGHGESEGGSGAANREVLAGDLVELLRYTSARRIDLLGHGRGGSALLALAERRPTRVRSLVLLDGETEGSDHSALEALEKAGVPTLLRTGNALRSVTAREDVLGFLAGLPDEG